jgi:sulfur carrier protein ThiS
MLRFFKEKTAPKPQPKPQVKKDNFIYPQVDPIELIEAVLNIGLNAKLLNFNVLGRTEVFFLQINGRVTDILAQKTALELRGELGLSKTPTIEQTHSAVDINGNIVKKRVYAITIVRTDNIINKFKLEQHKDLKGLEIPLGLGMYGTVYMDLLKAPHVLIAGTTGSGKSVMQNIIVKTILETHVDKAELVILDPKRVGFNRYKKQCEVLTDMDLIIDRLRDLQEQMDERYKLLEDTGYADIHAFNKSTNDPLPYMVCMVDEFKDLMNSERKDEVLLYIKRITAMARGAGIHLVIATQSPNAHVLPVEVRTNIQTRVIFRVGDKSDAEQILRLPQAYNLRGRGDGYFVDHESNVTRFSGFFYE